MSAKAVKRGTGHGSSTAYGKTALREPGVRFTQEFNKGRPTSGGNEDSDMSAANTPVRNLSYSGGGTDWKSSSAPAGSGAGTFSWGASKEVFTLSDRQQRNADIRSPLAILTGRLFYATSHNEPAPQSGVHFFSTERIIKYMPFCGDFGPFNLGMTIQFNQILREHLLNPRLDGKKIVYWSATDAASVTNAAYLLGAFLCVELNLSVDQAWLPFSSLAPSPFRPYRDATWAPSPFDLTIKDCWAGLLKARSTGLFDPAAFDKDEYFYYDHPANGDMHEVVKNKFFAFKGPTGTRRSLGFGRYSLIPSDYFDVWRSKKITTIVRLNTKEYNRDVVVKGGFKHHDLFFIDCSTPSDAICDRFLRIAETEQGAIAIHCLAGLGRTGTLIALYMMKHYKFTARECIGWLRICRPGSVIGPQQQYLVDVQQRMWDLGDKRLAGMGLSKEPLAMPADVDTSAEGSDPTSAKLAEMVTKGMKNRDFTRVSSTQDMFSSQAMSSSEGTGHVRQSTSMLSPGAKSRMAGGANPLRASQPEFFSSNNTSTPSPRLSPGSRKSQQQGGGGSAFARDVWGTKPGGVRSSLSPGSSSTTASSYLGSPGSPQRRRAAGLR